MGIEHPGILETKRTELGDQILEQKIAGGVAILEFTLDIVTDLLDGAKILTVLRRQLLRDFPRLFGQILLSLDLLPETVILLHRRKLRQNDRKDLAGQEQCPEADKIDDQHQKNHHADKTEIPLAA